MPSVPPARSIPACAGEPFRPPASPIPGKVYPRVCGGTQVAIDILPGTPGLSPRVRGNLRRIAEASGGAGSIPACAGEPHGLKAGGTLDRVYPRVCGGTNDVGNHQPAVGGLSPRVRGNPVGTNEPIPGHRSIPACAGEPVGNCRPACRPWVYPRVCGGTHPPAIVPCKCWGLSPRVRGNPPRQCSPRHRNRSIPACAGEPMRMRRPDGWRRVYPRVCGGTALGAHNDDAGAGLSPRVRGNRAVRRRFQTARGSIPACAGEPRKWRRPCGRGGVYPRVCGGTARRLIRKPRNGGLPPRVRGNRGGGG